MNNQQEFATLVATNKGILNKICNIYLPEGYAEEDLKQDILAEAWKSFSSFRGEAKFSTWLYVIARNTAIIKIRQLRAGLRLVSLDNPLFEVIKEEHGQEDRYMEEKLDELKRNRAKHLVSTLSERDQELVILYANKKSYEEMEEILGESQNLLRVRMSRIKDRLNKRFSNRPISIYD